MSEVDITCDHPITLAGRPDQVYLLANGRDIVLVDSKVRERVVVYDKDRVQLGASRVLFENSYHGTLRGMATVKELATAGKSWNSCYIWNWTALSPV